LLKLDKILLATCGQRAQFVQFLIHIVGYDALAHRIRGLKRITSINSNYHAVAEFTMKLIQDRVENRSKPITEFVSKMFDVSLYRRLGKK
jgi:hypothetical protein